MNRAEIETIRKTNRIKVKDLILEAGISKSTYYSVIYGRNITTESLEQTIRALNNLLKFS